MDQAQHEKDLNNIAEQSLDIVRNIASCAEDYLRQSGYGGEVITANSITDNAFKRLEQAKNSTEKDQLVLIERPAFMRVDLENADGIYMRSLYISPVAPPTGLSHWGEKKIDFVSYRAALGRVASLSCGSDIVIKEEEYYVSKKVEFTPKQFEELWDCKNVYITTEHERTTLDSLRNFLTALQDKGVDVDAYLAQLKEQENTLEGRVKNLTREIRSNMSLRSRANLDEYQDEIFRLPINSQRIILGPPGTGKTTTLIKRLGQKLDSNSGSFQDQELKLLKDLGKDGKGFSNWLMFTPSELLKTYLKEAFAKEGVVARDDYLKTWEYSRNLARQSLGILSSSTNKSGFLQEKNKEFVTESVIDDPRFWYESFEHFIYENLDLELKKGLSIVEQSSGLADDGVVQKLKVIIDGNSDIQTKYKKLFDLENQINKIIKKEKEISEKIISAERNTLINKNKQILEEMAKFLNTIKVSDTEEDDEDDEASYDDDEVEETVTYTAQTAALTTYQKFLRKLARYKYLRKTLPKNSKDAKLREWLDGKLPSDDTLNALGKSISLQNGFRHNLNCWKRLYKKPGKLYKQFRKEEINQYFYHVDTIDSKKISQSELDLILLVTLRSIKKLLEESYVIRNIDETRFQEIKGYRDSIFKDQIMVDEATDFSVLQLACMQSMTSPLLNSFFACGDFNQRLTNQGIKDIQLLKWISPLLEVNRINTIYRQSPKLNDFTHTLLDLMDNSDEAARSELPKFTNFSGLYPTLAEHMDDNEKVAEWITERIGEIEEIVNMQNIGDKIFPSIVVLVKEEQDVQSMTDTLDEHLAQYSLKADACLKGKSMGNSNDIRVCSIEYIKGLEFEAVFFVGIDELIRKNPDLYQKFLYVGATRAANYLGMTCTEQLPEQLASLRPMLIDNWHLDALAVA